MLIWKTLPVQVTVAGSEVTRDFIGYQAGKTRTIKYVAGPPTIDLWLAGYRTSEKVVEFDTKLLTSGFPLLPCSVVIKEGDTFRAGVSDKGAGADTYNVTVGYEETPD